MDEFAARVAALPLHEQLTLLYRLIGTNRDVVARELAEMRRVRERVARRKGERVSVPGHSDTGGDG